MRFKVIIAATAFAACAAAFAQSGARTGQGDTLPWPTKAALLAAARAGDFNGLPEIRGDVERQTATLVASVMNALRTEYGVPPLPKDRSCTRGADSEVQRLLTFVVEAELSTLTAKPPEFRQARDERFDQFAKTEFAKLGSGGGWCESEVLGKRKAHPYGDALLKFATEFDNAVEEWVVAEAARRKTAYAEEQARLAAEQKAKADAQAKRDAEEQKRIAAERARIEAEQKRQREANKQRVGG